MRCFFTLSSQVAACVFGLYDGLCDGPDCEIARVRTCEVLVDPHFDYLLFKIRPTAAAPILNRVACTLIWVDDCRPVFVAASFIISTSE